jgi:hypothetical protein
MLSSPARGKLSDEAVTNEYRAAIVFQNLALDLALKLVSSTRRHAGALERDVPGT